MKILNIRDKATFGSVRLYHISSGSKTGKFLQEAAKEAVNANEIKNLEKQGMIFDFVRVFNNEGKKTNQVQFFLSRRPDYVTKDGLIPIKNVISKIESLSDAKQFVSTVIEKSKNFLPEHLGYIKNYFANGGEIKKRTTVAKMENTV